ncbi:hypothetical protein Forpe1208_v012439 [Fusarium oxysporum f. sp. rapae]|uniref:GH18 domain-containing protein n=1 Tax=Fusarium oxysporum f. sp. rapae TaxID=485398 RepID=A0A8J5NRQ2_FUSOX|nr:hypothetical protein Forpe1208_v012439 [Fusarium oxysporum f. sp. rapae]
MLFANSSLLTVDPSDKYKPFRLPQQVHDLFHHQVKVSLSMDIDWEYPGSNGEHYRQVPNCNKKGEIKAFPVLLKEIKKYIGGKELSIAGPSFGRDMVAYTSSEVPHGNDSGDFVNVTYDLMNRRDHTTTHHVSIKGAVSAIDKYISVGFPASRLVEDPDVSDTGKSGSMTFEAANFTASPDTHITTPDNTCGLGKAFKCPEGSCCGSAGCGSTPAHCGTSNRFRYGKCDGIDISRSFHKAPKNGYTDDDNGAQWYQYAETSTLWSWDTQSIRRKITLLADTRNTKGVIAWAVAQSAVTPAWVAIFICSYL